MGEGGESTRGGLDVILSWARARGGIKLCLALERGEKGGGGEPSDLGSAWLNGRGVAVVKAGNPGAPVEITPGDDAFEELLDGEEGGEK